MATITSNASGSWATGLTWIGGVKPADNDAVVIAAGHEILMNDDLSAYTGLQTVTISGHDTTPGMLYFKAGTSGYLKIRTGYNLVGTNFANRGRLVANSEGTFAGTTALPYADKAIIDLQGTSKIDALYLDLMLYHFEPSVKAVRTYGVKHRVTGSASADTLTKNSHGLAGATAVMIMSTGTLPAPLQTDMMYYTKNVATNTFQLSYVSSGTVIDLTTDGTGDIDVYTGHTSTSTGTMNVLDDVTAVTGWVTTDGHDHVVLANHGTQNYDQQKLQLTTINAGTIVLSANVDSVQYPGAKIFLVSRNVSIRSSGTTTAQGIIDYGVSTFTGNKIGCEIRNSGGTGTTFYGNGIFNGYGHTVSGVISGCYYGVSYGYTFVVSSTICGNNSGFNYCSGMIISGIISGCGYCVNNCFNSVVSGTVSGCSLAVYSCIGITISGTIYNCGIGIAWSNKCIFLGYIYSCSHGVSNSSGLTVIGEISKCTTGINNTDFLLLGTLANNTTDVTFLGVTTGPLVRGRAFKYGGVANDTRGWSAGGTLTHETTTVPANHAYSHKFTYVAGNFWNVFDWEISRTGSNYLQFPVFAKHDATSLSADQRLHFQIISLAADPLVSVSNTPLAEWIAADSSDWQSSALSYTKADDLPLVFRICAKRASGSSYALFDPCTVQSSSTF
jgi:hypothetical protein